MRGNHGIDTKAHADPCFPRHHGKHSLGTRLVIDSFGEAFSAKRIVVAGGPTKSRLWLQIHADTIGAPLELTEVPDAPALGCAILAACAEGRFATLKKAARQCCAAAQ